MLRAKIAAVHHRMHARVCAAAAGHGSTHARHRLHGVLDALLHGDPIGLDLPAVIGLSVKTQNKQQIAHGRHLSQISDFRIQTSGICRLFKSKMG